jgi:hypothetical protein
MAILSLYPGAIMINRRKMARCALLGAVLSGSSLLGACAGDKASMAPAPKGESATRAEDATPGRLASLTTTPLGVNECVTSKFDGDVDKGPTYTNRKVVLEVSKETRTASADRLSNDFYYFRASRGARQISFGAKCNIEKTEEAYAAASKQFMRAVFNGRPHATGKGRRISAAPISQPDWIASEVAGEDSEAEQEPTSWPPGEMESVRSPLPESNPNECRFQVYEEAFPCFGGQCTISDFYQASLRARGFGTLAVPPKDYLFYVCYVPDCTSIGDSSDPYTFTATTWSFYMEFTMYRFDGSSCSEPEDPEEDEPQDSTNVSVSGGGSGAILAPQLNDYPAEFDTLQVYRFSLSGSGTVRYWLQGQDTLCRGDIACAPTLTGEPLIVRGVYGPNWPFERGANINIAPFSGCNDPEEVVQSDTLLDGTGTTVNIDAFATLLRARAQPNSVHRCARYVGTAMCKATGGNFAPMCGSRPDAWNWASWLIEKGFQQVASGATSVRAAGGTNPNFPPGYQPAKGDIAVMRYLDASGNQSGHVCAWDGQDWIADYVQNKYGTGGGHPGLNPNPGRYPNQAYQIYRLP